MKPTICIYIYIHTEICNMQIYRYNIASGSVCKGCQALSPAMLPSQAAPLPKAPRPAGKLESRKWQ